MISEFPNIVYPEITSIIPDLQFAGKAAVKKLYEKGCRKLAFISTDAKKNKSSYLHLLGFMDAVRELGLSDENYVIAEADIYKEKSFTIAGYKAAEKAFELMPDIDGILGWTGSFTAGIMQYIYKLGLRIPDQIKIIGTDDDVANFLSPPLTTVNISIHRRCLEALELLLRLQDEDEWKHKKQIYLSPSFYYRGTLCD
jgi:DNA-binding LacI/PurR family transcriptional regulator